MGVADGQTMTFISQTYQRADAFLFGRRTCELFRRPRIPLMIIWAHRPGPGPGRGGWARYLAPVALSH
jgi:hypothetical protein